MAKYHNRPAIIEAGQWFPGKDTVGVLTVIDGVYEGKQYVMTAHSQPVFLEPGDWVVAEPDGRGYYPIKPDIFEAKYMEIFEEE